MQNCPFCKLSVFYNLTWDNSYPIIIISENAQCLSYFIKINNNTVPPVKIHFQVVGGINGTHL